MRGLRTEVPSPPPSAQCRVLLSGIVNSTVPHFFTAWTAFSTIEQVDFTRYALLYGEGGVYADADQQVRSSQARLEHGRK